MSILKQSTLKETPQARKIELRLLIVTAFLLLIGLGFVYLAKTQKPLNFAELPELMEAKEVEENGKKVKKLPEIVNFKNLKTKEAWLPYLVKFEDEEDRYFAAEQITNSVNDPESKIQNVGFLGTIRVGQKEIDAAKDLDYYPQKLTEATTRAKERKENAGFVTRLRDSVRNLFGREDPPITVSVLGGLGSLKSSFIVRTPEEFKTSLIISSIIFFASFLILHLIWRFRKFNGDGLILPPIFLLCGIGYLMMISFRDPLRDTLLFADFSFGVAIGCGLMAVVTLVDFHDLYFKFVKKFPKFSESFINYAPIALAIFLSLLLIFIGTAPGVSDAKVNLTIPGVGQVQPSEVIRILFALFVALYFAEHWEYFRFLEKATLKGLFTFPRLKDIYLLVIFVGCLILLFIAQKDLGPALLMSGMFLTLFAVVRKKIGLSIIGLSAIVGVYLFNYFVWTFSLTAVDRLNIWLNPWDTEVSGGEQIVHSLWSFADGGLFGTGLGLGDPNFAPAHHTDLILASIGNELGFVGIALIFAVYSFLFYRCYLIAQNAFSPFTYLFALGLTVINALQLLFIFAAVLGIIPLSGVITPFLSQGMSSTICNFAAFGLLLAISDEPNKPQTELNKPTKYLVYGFAVLLCLIMFKAFTIQVWRSDEILVKGVLAPVPDEVFNGETVTKLRRYTYNPRIAQAKKQLPFGSIYDRNGIPLASNNWDELTKFAKEYESLGVYLDNVCKKGKRCYPFGNKIFHLIGNYATEQIKDLRKTNKIELEYESVLRGYNDYEERIPSTGIIKKPILDENSQQIIDPETKKPKFDEKPVEIEIVSRDYKELLPLIRNRYNPINIEANLLKYKNRNIQTSFDIRLQIRLGNLLKTELLPIKKKGAIVVLEPKTGDLLASVNFPFPDEDLTENQKAVFDDGAYYFDRARAGFYPPGSTFKIVTSMAALRKEQTEPKFEYSDIQLSGGRVGNIVRKKEVKDDIKDSIHSNVDLRKGLIVSCNAYFATLADKYVGADELFKTADLFEIKTSNANTASGLNDYLEQAAFGQGQVVATPFQIARVASTVANGGIMNFGRWVTDENNARKKEPIQIINADLNAKIAEALRGVVNDPNGTAKGLNDNSNQIAGKTGTAENPFGSSHSWFAGFAPYNDESKRIAFAVLIENGGYGGGLAAKISGEVVDNAKTLGLIQ